MNCSRTAITSYATRADAAKGRRGETPRPSAPKLGTRPSLSVKGQLMTSNRRKSRKAKPKSADPALRGIPPVREDGTRDWGSMASRARREVARNTARVNEGETYRAGKRSAKQGSPSSLRGGKYA